MQLFPCGRFSPKFAFGFPTVTTMMPTTTATMVTTTTTTTMTTTVTNFEIIRLDSSEVQGLCLGADNLTTVGGAVKLLACDRFSMKFEQRDGFIRTENGLCLHAANPKPNEQLSSFHVIASARLSS